MSTAALLGLCGLGIGLGLLLLATAWHPPDDRRKTPPRNLFRAGGRGRGRRPHARRWAGAATAAGLAVNRPGFVRDLSWWL